MKHLLDDFAAGSSWKRFPSRDEDLGGRLRCGHEVSVT